MRPIVVILLVAVVLIDEQAARAQGEAPIRYPEEGISLYPETPEATCTQYWDLPSPMLGVNWRVYPPPGLLEESPERFSRERGEWQPGIGSSVGDLEGPRFFTYDEAGRVSTWTITFGSIADLTKNRIESLYAYDESGNLTSVTRQSLESDSLIDQDRRIYTYTPAGGMDSELRHGWNGDWYMNFRTSCSYDLEGRLEYRIGQTCTPSPVDDPNPPCQDVDSTRYDYDASGRITTEYRRTRIAGRAWETPLPVRYTYDVEGRLVEEIDSDSRARFVWVYDDYGRLSEQTVFTFGDRTRTRYEYQHAGLLTRVATDTWLRDLEAWAEVGEVRYQYSPLLNLGAEYRYTGPSIIWLRRHYEYDSRDNLMSSAQDEWAGSSWRPVYTGEFIYHDAGFLEEYRFSDASGPREERNRVLYGYAVGTGLSGGQEDLSQRVGLEPNYPNPSGLETTISYTLPHPAHIGLYVFDLMGRQVRTLVSGPRSAGRHQVRVELADLPAGIYFYRLETGRAVATRRMVVVR